VSQLRTLLAVVLPLRTSTIDEVLALVAWVQQRNHQAYLGGEHDSCKIPDSPLNVLKFVELSRLSHLDFRSGFGAVFQGVLWVFTLSINR
jgi:hypothetical protein